jgi:hypothetical protein
MLRGDVSGEAAQHRAAPEPEWLVRLKTGWRWSSCGTAMSLAPILYIGFSRLNVVPEPAERAGRSSELVGMALITLCLGVTAASFYEIYESQLEIPDENSQAPKRVAPPPRRYWHEQPLSIAAVPRPPASSPRAIAPTGVNVIRRFPFMPLLRRRTCNRARGDLVG